jgi:hypothetical protein
MQYEEALNIIKLLAGGINPVTKQPFPSDSVYNDPTIIRALYTVSDPKTHKPKKIKPTPKKTAQNAGKKWNLDEDNALTEAFRQGMSESEMAVKFGRTKFAITSRLVKLDLIDRNKLPTDHTQSNKTVKTN